MDRRPVSKDAEPEQQGARLLRRFGIGLAVLGVGGVIALLVIGLAARNVDDSIDRAIARGDPEPAPEFTLPVLANGAAVGKRDGDSLSLSELRGKGVVLNFWASWCDPCKREAPALEAAWQRIRDRGGVVLGLDVQDLRSDALEFIDEYGQTYPHVRDKGDRVYRSYGLTGVPETFFIDRAGRVRAHWIGEINAEQIADGIDLILEGDRR